MTDTPKADALRKALRCLRLEVHGSIADDVEAKATAALDEARDEGRRDEREIVMDAWFEYEEEQSSRREAQDACAKVYEKLAAIREREQSHYPAGLTAAVRELVEMPGPSAHYGHFDPEGTRGANCKGCKSDARLRAALARVREMMGESYEK